MPPSSISPIRPFFLLTGLTSTRSPAFQLRHAGADLGNLAGHVEADDHRQRHLDAGHALHGEHVVIVERGGAHADHHMAFGGLRHRVVSDHLQFVQPAVLPQHQRLHRLAGHVVISVSCRNLLSAPCRLCPYSQLANAPQPVVYRCPARVFPFSVRPELGGMERREVPGNLPRLPGGEPALQARLSRQDFGTQVYLEGVGVPGRAGPRRESPAPPSAPFGIQYEGRAVQLCPTLVAACTTPQ